MFAFCIHPSPQFPQPYFLQCYKNVRLLSALLLCINIQVGCFSFSREDNAPINLHKQGNSSIIHGSQIDCKMIMYLIKKAINGPACTITAFDEVEHRSNRYNIFIGVSSSYWPWVVKMVSQGFKLMLDLKHGCNIVWFLQFRIWRATCRVENEVW